jgi:hypothetical protein
MTDEEYQAILNEVKEGLEQVVKAAVHAMADKKFSPMEVMRTVQLASNLGMTVYYAVGELDTKAEQDGLIDYVQRAEFRV